MDSEGEADLKTLQKIWYEKLREEGFEDIEVESHGRNYLKNWHSRYFFIRYTPDQIEEQLTYMRMAAHFLWHYQGFQNDLEREIWRLHTDGYSRRKITDILKTFEIETSPGSVQIILTRLKKIMHTQTWPSSEEGAPDRSDDL